MFKKLIFLMLLPLVVFGGNLVLKNGLIQAHTKVFGDSSIDPAVSKIHTELSMQGDNLKSIKGSISFSIMDFKSSNSSRDEHMQKMFSIDKYADISLSIVSIDQKSANYLLKGVLKMHGVDKNIVIPSSIIKKGDTVSLNSNFSVKVSDYGMEAPSLFFFTVRNRVDINATITLVKK